MQSFKGMKGRKFDLELVKVGAAGVSLLSSLMGAIYFSTLGIPYYITGVIAVCGIVVHLQFFFKRDGK